MRHHNFSHTVTEHHDDGSHTIHHVHKKHGFVGPEKRDGDVKGAAMNHDAMMDHIMDHTSMPNPGEGKNADNEAMGEQVSPGAHPNVAAMQQGA
jgi:hypothetical protein